MPALLHIIAITLPALIRHAWLYCWYAATAGCRWLRHAYDIAASCWCCDVLLLPVLAISYAAASRLPRITPPLIMGHNITPSFQLISDELRLAAAAITGWLILRHYAASYASIPLRDKATVTLMLPFYFADIIAAAVIFRRLIFSAMQRIRLRAARVLRCKRVPTKMPCHIEDIFIGCHCTLLAGW